MDNTQELVALAVRLRLLGPTFVGRLRELEALAGPDTWRGRVPDVFAQELRDHIGYLQHLDERLAEVALEIEMRAAGPHGPGLVPTGGG